ncbi:DUF3108 domain-containing protein [Bdellovibrio svalbardensis]|uniref:DUF3108 domain-containing protein n=1 Tax=Bdellovibrio svalbardensis TaxID=2972972 RepID=A0ABT6DQU4_9BACT|nr:DUF3108 domain-containing protein [Bdellovibrio svalbardensis]MDG0817533.1 DUF3108 domain-containing protein [Bdellovibrio svalbardensis]
MKYSSFLIISTLLLSSCSTSFLKYEKADQLKKMDEFDEKVKIVEPSATATPEATSAVSPPAKTEVAPAPAKKPAKSAGKTSPSLEKKTETKVKAKSKKEAAVVAAAPVAEAVVTRRQPDIEDDAGFDGRRPIQDPIRVGEEVIHDVNYFKVSAGTLKMRVDPFVTVNDRKAYSLKMFISTSSLFSSFYSVDDSVDIFMDYNSLVPSVFQLHVKESGQLREAKMLFNDKDSTATFWEKKVTEKDGVEEKKQHWDILPYTQNVYSAVFYMRFFQWEVGKEYAFRVANDKENLVFSGKALRKEVLETKLGPMKAIVIQPNIMLKGKFKSIGENLIWLSDDDRRYILRIEAKIKIGTLISEVVEIKPGK